MLRTLRLMAYVCLPIFTLWLSSLWAPAAYGGGALVLYVDKDATGGAGIGTSWANAYTTLQGALDMTNANNTTAFEIWMAEGVYYPDEGGSHVADAQSESFHILYNNVQMYGGFAATETLRTQRIPSVNLTILSGDIDGNDTNTDGNSIAETYADIQGSNAYHVLYLDGQTNEALTTATVLDGFIVTAGSATSSKEDSKGGGLYCAGTSSGNGCSPTVAQVTFTGNKAGSGGGMFNNGFSDGISSPALTNVTFAGNKAVDGGGMANDGYGGVSSPVLTNVTFTGNTADLGGGIFCSGYTGTSSPVLTNVTFNGNRAFVYGGGMFNSGDSGVSSPVLTNVTFGGNMAVSGGGMYNSATNFGTSSPQLVNVIMWGDSASEDAEIYNDGATPDISYSDIDKDGILGTGNIRQDPQFKAPVNASSAPTSSGNYHIRLSSPAIDAGSPTACPAPDMDGTARPLDGNGDGSAICDMGAYETQVLFVDVDAAGGTHDGKTWVSAYTTLQEALDWTNAHNATFFEIWVAKGVYYPDFGGRHVADSPSESFHISYDNVQIYGGFAGSETARSQRDPAVHRTILSGDIDGNDTNSDGNSIAETSADIQGSNAYHVVYLDGESNEAITVATVLDGFIITAGSADDNSGNSDGGGAYCAGDGNGNGCSPTIANVTFSGNQARKAGGGITNKGRFGGVSNPVFTNVTFTGNGAGEFGGGMSNAANGGGTSSPKLTNVIFSGNKAGFIGGGIGGGLYNGGFGGVSSPVLTNVTFSGNQASYGGGMANLVSGSGTSSPQLVNVIMWGNSAPNGPEIYNEGGTPAISYSDIDQDGITGTGNIRQAPLLSSLADHGGGMLTFALLPGSPAIDTGNSAACAAAPVNNLDQRGVVRPQGGGCDLGAFESRGFTLSPAGGSPQETPIFTTFALPLAVLAGSTNTEPLGAGGVITLTPPATGPGLSVTAPFTISTDAAGLTAGTIVTANGVVGSFTITATAAGAVSPAILSLANTQGTPTVTLAINPNPAPYNAALTLTATVTTTLGEGFDPLTGSVVFTDTSNVINLSSALAGGRAVVPVNALPAGIYTVTATYGGDGGHLPGAATATVQVLPAPLPPHARADVAAVLQDTPLMIDVLANDVPGTNQQLTVYTVTQPLIGGLAALEQNQVRFIPTAGFTGLITFTTTIHDGNGLAGSAPVTVRVMALNTTDGEPQVLSLPAPADNGRGTVTVPAGTTEIEVPAGAITPAEDPLATYDLVYQELNAPEPSLPSTLFTFGGRAFVLQLFINAELQPDYVFNVPIYLTISYDPNVVTDTSKLVLYYYDEGSRQWANDGIIILSVDTQNHTFRASLAHLTEFAAGITVPTGLDPNLEPQLLPQLFLPQVYH